MLHQEADGVSILATAKTMEKLFCGTDRKTGRFFAMERAEPHEVGAAFFELDVATHDLHDINAGEQFLDERLRYGHEAIFTQVQPC